MEGLAAFGIVEVVDQAPRPLAPAQALRQDFRAGRYDLVILIDYPGFHLRVAEAARQAGTKVLYYIAPQLWAWRPERARRLAAAVDRLAVVLPFEQPFFGRLGLRSDYVGHPLVDRGPSPGRAAARAPARHSRGRQGAGDLPRQPGARRSAASGFPSATPRSSCCGKAAATASWWRGPPTGSIRTRGRRRSSAKIPASLFAAADAALAKSGTTTLEAALADTPMVVAYKVHPLTYHLFQRLRTVHWVSLVNLVAEREVVPELLQDRAETPALVEALRPCSIPAIPGPSGSGKGSPWSAPAWATPARPTGWWPWPTSC